MPRTARLAPGGMVFHVLNRGVGRMRLFLKDGDFEAFERGIAKTFETRPMRILAYCLMSNHCQFDQVVRYVERNALRANLVARAEDRRWSSLWRRVRGTTEDRRWLGRWPLPLPRNWAQLVNEPQTESELESLRRSVTRGQPYGEGDWVKQTAKRLGLPSTLRPRGRPKSNRTKPPRQRKSGN
jgi:putative transposase